MTLLHALLLILQHLILIGDDYLPHQLLIGGQQALPSLEGRYRHLVALFHGYSLPSVLAWGSPGLCPIITQRACTDKEGKRKSPRAVLKTPPAIPRRLGAASGACPRTSAAGSTPGAWPAPGRGGSFPNRWSGRPPPGPAAAEAKLPIEVDRPEAAGMGVQVDGEILRPAWASTWESSPLPRPRPSSWGRHLQPVEGGDFAVGLPQKAGAHRVSWLSQTKRHFSKNSFPLFW